MMATMRKNLHVPLPDDLNDELRTEAERSGQPAAEIARDAIRQFLRERRRQTLHEGIAACARTVAGTAADLDRELEDSALEDFGSLEET
jgi:predicted transcriptional regulator